jgi:hypothetical protein
MGGGVAPCVMSATSKNEHARAKSHATRPLVRGNETPTWFGRASFARCRDFLLRLAGCQGKDAIAEGRRGAPATGSFCGRGVRRRK